MASDYSDSDDDRHRSRHKLKRHSRSRTTSRDRNRSRKSKKSKQKHRSKSRSRSPERRNRRRSRSRSSDYNSKRRGHRKSKSRSHSHSRSDHDSRRSSRSRDSQKAHSSKVSDHGKETTTNNAQMAEQKLQKALKAAITADDILRAQGIEEIATRVKKTQLSFEEQQKRASAINDIESGDFVQETFKSTRSEIPMPSGSSVDASHAGAMFSSGATILLSTNLTVLPNMLPSNSNSIMHPNLYIGVDEKMEKWKQKVIQLRKQKLVANISVS